MATAIGIASGREMTVGGVLSHGFGAVRAAPVVFLGVSFLLVALPSSLIGIAMRGAMVPAYPSVSPFSPVNPLAHLWPMLAGAGLVWWLLYLAGQAVLIRATVAVLDGRHEPVAHAAGAVRSILPLLGLSILLSMAVWLGFILFVVPGIILAIMWSVAAPALVAERRGVLAAMGRSRYLTKGARWRVFGLVVLVFAIYWFAAAVVGAGNVAANGLSAAAASRAAPSIVSTLISLVLQTAFVALWSAIQAALYVDLRDWKDGPAGDRLADIFA